MSSANQLRRASFELLAIVSGAVERTTQAAYSVRGGSPGGSRDSSCMHIDPRSHPPLRPAPETLAGASYVDIVFEETGPGPHCPPALAIMQD